MEYAAISDKGIIREQNEDFWNIVLDLNENPIAFIVADGMGGHQAGDVASRMAVEIISDEISRFIESKDAGSSLSMVFEKAEISTTSQLVDIIKAAIPAQARRKGPHPAKRTFQAIRIAVNRELEALKNVLPEAFDLLNTAGRMCVITFHSLEDRIVKQFIRERIGRCKCPPGIPKCVCNAVRELKQINSKPITPSADELKQNHRARSAKLRIVEKL